MPTSSTGRQLMWPFSLCTTSTVGCPGSSQRPTSSWNGIVAAAMSGEEGAERERRLGRERREDRADEAGEAEGRVVRRDHAVADVVLHADALDVHRRVDRPEPEADHDHADEQHRDAAGVPDEDETEGHERAADPQQHTAPVARCEGTREHAADAGDDRHEPDQQAQLAVGEVEPRLQRGDPGHQAGEADPLHDEGHGDGETCAAQIHPRTLPHRHAPRAPTRRESLT